MRVANLSAFRAAAILGLVAVGLGAFGAHGLKATLLARGTAEFWYQALLLHFEHTLVLLGLSCLRPFAPGPWFCFGAGILCFSGSLYAYAVSGIHWLVFVTPLGGLCFLAGWIWLFIAASRFATAE